MYARPDYSTARAEAGFGYSVSTSQGALRDITGTPIREFNLEPDACIDAFRRGRPMLREMFGEEVGWLSLYTPAISYGHVNCLGSELLFPEGGEVAHTHIYSSLEEGIRALRQPINWGQQGMLPYFLEFRERMREAFPGEPAGLAFGAEGPITTAYELRGEGFFTDMLDDVDLACEFLTAIVDSMLDYHRYECEREGTEPVNPHGSGICDDLSAFVPARLFDKLVVPYWDRYYDGMTTGTRSAHVEDLRAEQLPFLETIGLASFDPSISPHLTPPILTEGCRVPYWWRLGEIHYPWMSCQEVEDFVFQSCADGASGVVTYVAEGMCNERGVQQIAAFIRAGKQAQQMLAEGASRAEVGECVSAEGRAKLWQGWVGCKL